MKNKMPKKISLVDIVKSKFSNKEDLAPWYEERLSICQTCPLNSINKPRKEQTVQEKAWVTANMGKPTCLACKCEITAKASLPHATCGKKVIGLEPEWNPIHTVSKTESQTIQVNPIDPVTLRSERGEEIIDFGRIKVGEPKRTQIIIEDHKQEMTDIKVQSSCGCTVPKVEQKDSFITLEVKYKNETTGMFNKTVIMTYIKNNINFEKIFKITGNSY
jgi:hypothetical protein